MAAVIINKHKKRKKDADKQYDAFPTLYVSLGPASRLPRALLAQWCDCCDVCLVQARATCAPDYCRLTTRCSFAGGVGTVC